MANLGRPERRTLDGREYLVSPITILPPGGGVMNGSKGPLYYSDPVCKSQPGAWNDVPITGRHPVAANGKHISATDPTVVNQKIGFLANDHVKDGRRRVYGWLDVENAREYDRREGTSILADWESGRLQEVSTGLITQDSPAQNGASHNGRAYAWTVTGWTPDHLAVLPDQRGACSIADGCGVNNAEQAEAAKRTIWQKLGEFLGVTSNAGGDNCGIGEGGFQEGNTCGKGGGGGRDSGLMDRDEGDDTHDKSRDSEKEKKDATEFLAAVKRMPKADRGRHTAAVKKAKKTLSTNVDDDVIGLRSAGGKLVSEETDLEAIRSAAEKSATGCDCGGTCDECKVRTENADLEGGRWVTTDDGNRVYIKDGKAVAGNPRVLEKMKGDNPNKSQSSKKIIAKLSKIVSMKTSDEDEMTFDKDIDQIHMKEAGFKGKGSGLLDLPEDDSEFEEATVDPSDVYYGQHSVTREGVGKKLSGHVGDDEFKAVGLPKAVRVPAGHHRLAPGLYMQEGHHRAFADALATGKVRIKIADLQEGDKQSKSNTNNTGKYGNPQSQNTGKFKRHGSGAGKGEPHERAQAGAMMITDRDRELGADAARQLAETGHNPASWVADEATWDRAKEAAAKTYGEGDESYWPAVAHIYKQMGGEVKDATENAFAAILDDIEGEDVVNTFCATGEGGGVDPSCGKEGGSGDSEIIDGHPIGLWKQLDKFDGEESTARKLADLADKYGLDASYLRKTLSGGTQVAGGSGLFKDNLKSQVASLAVTLQSKDGFFEAVQQSKKTNNESGSILDVFNEGDTPMTLKPEQRKVIVRELTANCDCWKGEAETLNEMSDEQLVKHAKSHQQSQADAIVANATRDVFKPPADLKLNEFPAFLKKKKGKSAEDEETVYGKDDEEDEDADEKDGEEVAENRASARRIAANAGKPRKPQTAEQWLTNPDVPEEIRHAARFAMNAERGQREQIVGQLVANVEDDKRRERLAARYMNPKLYTLNDLQDELATRPQPEHQRHEPIGFYFGGGAGREFVSNDDQSDPETDAEIGMMDSPTVNFERKVEERQTA